MSKLKNCKILLLLLLFALSAQNASAGYDAWFHFQAETKTNTGEGLVYGDFENQSAQDETLCESSEIQSRNHKHFDNLSSHPTSMSLDYYMVAKAQDGYRFVEWDNVDKENYTKVTNSKYGTKYGITDVTVGYASAPVSSSNKCSDNSSYDQTGHNKNPDTLYSTNATFFAKFEPLPDASQRAVIAKINNALYGAAGVYPIENQVDDEVKLFVVGTSDLKNRLGYEKKFLGWEKDGIIVSKDTILSFRITNENKGTYTAIFEDGYKFHRIKNRATGNYITAINDQGGLTNLSALKLVKGLDNVICDAGSIIEISKGQVYNDKKTSRRTYYNYIVQGADAIPFYDFKYDDPNNKNPYTPGGVFVRMPYNASYNNWLFSTDDVGTTRLRDNEGTPSFTALKTSDTEWYIEPIDKDLETCENYFSLDPEKLELVQVGDKYYTTLRTSWNILFNPEQMTPYVVTSVDEETGTFEMEPITGNIIPLGTPVIIETKSTDIEENRMVPTTTTFTGTKPATNLLTTSEKYFPNQSVSGNYKALMVNGEGQLAFGGDALTTVNGNEAYLQVANEVALKPIADLPTLATLKTIESTGEKGKLYTVEDRLVAVAFAVDEQENCALLWCKDQAESNAKTEVKTGQTDYMKNQYAKLYNSPAPEKWDQSNWVAVKLVPYKNVGLSDIATRLKNDVVGHVLKPKAVTGIYSDDVNYTIAMAMPEQDGKEIFENMIGDAFTYNENLYCTANFLSENLVGENGVTQSAAAEHYYFVNPKIQEVAEVTFAVWNGSYFVAPAPQEGTSTNESEINGAFNVDWRYNSYDINTLASNKAYQFMAVVQKPVAVAGGMGLKDESEVTPMDCTPDGTYMVFPLNLDPSNKDQVITSIAQPVVSKTVSRVVYYNLMGVASAVPFQGVNIVVTEYSDGSRQARKVVMK